MLLNRKKNRFDKLIEVEWKIFSRLCMNDSRANKSSSCKCIFLSLVTSIEPEQTAHFHRTPWFYKWCENVLREVHWSSQVGVINRTVTKLAFQPKRNPSNPADCFFFVCLIFTWISTFYRLFGKKLAISIDQSLLT